METTPLQSISQLSAEEDRINEAIRNQYFERKRHTPMPNFLKSMLVASVEKNMAEYAVEFLDNDQKLHVLLPPGNYLRLGTRCVARRELEKAMQKTRLSTFFKEKKSKNLEMLANITKKLVEDHGVLEEARKKELDNSDDAKQDLRME